MTKENLKFLLIYASQTGQAQAIAEEIAELAPDQGFHADVHCMSHVEKKFSLERENLVVIITSTTGDGEPPETALKFWRRIRKKTLPNTHFGKLKYALLGLGDTNYTNFCKCGKSLDHRLEELGAKRFYHCGWADDATGLEVEVEPWIEGLWDALRNNLPVSEKSPSNCLKTEENLLTGMAETPNDSQCAEHTLDDKIHLTNCVSGVSQDISSTTQPDTPQLVVQNGAVSVSETNGVDQSVTNKPLAGVLPTKAVTQSDTSGSSLPSVDSNLTESLTCSVPPLSEQPLTLPVCPPQFLQIEWGQRDLDLSDIPLQNGASMPSASSDITAVPIVSARKLTSPDAVKTALLLTLNINGCNWSYSPGDSFSIICVNSDSEVQLLLDRLNSSKVADMPYTLTIKIGTKKRNAAVPSFIPATATLRHVLKTCCDFRKVPKKALIRALVEYTSHPNEKRRLQELCSKQGAEAYFKYIRGPSLGVLDILLAFPSCQPPIEILLEHIERLQPRPYSIASSPLKHPHHIDIVFNIVEIEAGLGRHSESQGICTGWLNRITLQLQQESEKQYDPSRDVTSQLEQLSLDKHDLSMVPVFLRSNQHFRPPNDLSVPIIMIGPGTGVAPFIGFLQHREHQMSADPNAVFGQSWLIFGCRHRERDFLFRHELETFKEKGTLTTLLVSFSRDSQPEDSPKYVQDNIRRHGKELTELLTERDAIVYVCGDANNMSKDVNASFVGILQEFKGWNEKDALGFIAKLRLGSRYCEDVWT